ncbi:MAG TPA: aminoacyl-tRNA hydrolase, partial [Aggregatilineales bacterium]|nr:aminoacyl-tRNA hydrolase [Aggregatilineales bacterium]
LIGLGNPGRDYAATRHNVGFRSVDALAAAHGLAFTKKQAKALIADGTIADRKVILAKPQTYMNLSGESVRGLLNFYKVPIANLLVISDDLDLPVGTLRIREKGSAGGQKGLKNIIEHLHTLEFARMRIGIGRPPGRMDAAAYVLQPFDKADDSLVQETIERAVRAAETWLELGTQAAMNRFNGSPDEAAAPREETAPRRVEKPERGKAAVEPTDRQSIRPGTE